MPVESATAPTFTVHVVVEGAPVQTTEPAGTIVVAVRDVRLHPTGATAKAGLNVTVASTPVVVADPVVQEMVPSLFTPVTVVQVGLDPAAAPGAIVGSEPAATIWAIFM